MSGIRATDPTGRWQIHVERHHGDTTITITDDHDGTLWVDTLTLPDRIANALVDLLTYVQAHDPLELAVLRTMADFEVVALYPPRHPDATTPAADPDRH